MSKEHGRKVHALRDLTKSEASEEAIYKRQLMRSWGRRPGGTWIKKLEREEMENAEE